MATRSPTVGASPAMASQAPSAPPGVASLVATSPAMPSPAVASPAVGGGAAAVPDGLDPSSRAALAGVLDTTMASIRRAGRRQRGRPVELLSLTGAQLELLRLVRRRPGLSVTEAAEELVLAPNTVSTLVSQLTEAGLVHRQVDPSDRRVARLELSPDVARKTDAWLDRRILALGEAIGRLSGPDQYRLAATMPVLVTLAEQLETAGHEG
jgi:DNA-binding MarR family transcriptional regulator